MIAVDTNILIYAHRQESPKHADALGAITALAEGNDPWAVPVFVVTEFLRVVTHPRVYSPPTSREIAIEVIEELMDSPTMRLLRPGERFWPLLADALGAGNATGNLVFDAQIVAVCRENGVERILSEDRDLLRFPSIKVQKLEDL